MLVSSLRRTATPWGYRGSIELGATMPPCYICFVLTMLKRRSLLVRFTGQAICSLGANKAGASQLLAGGALEILANLSKSQQPTRSNGNSGNGHDSVDSSSRGGGGGGGRQGGRPPTVDTLLVGETSLLYSWVQDSKTLVEIIET